MFRSRSRSRSRQFALAAAFALPLLAGGFFLGARSTRDSARLFDEVMQFVSTRYVDSVPSSDLYEKAARGLVKEIQDPYSALYSPKELAEFTATTGGHYGGLGMLVEDQQGTTVVSRVYPHTPAEAGGVREGDRIVGVDEKPTHGWKLVQVTDALKGNPGTPVAVTFMRPGVMQPINMKFTRAVIRIPAVPYAVMLDKREGYIPLLQFNETAAAETQQAVRDLQAQGARGIILDLRGNGGGIVDEAIAISNMFLQPGLEIASVRGRDGPAQRYVSEGPPIAPTVPVIVLIDGYTASASEIVAGALQDHDRALVVGTTSFGKGLVQSLYQLDDGWALKLTTAKWFTPSGRSIHKDRKWIDGQPADDPDSAVVDTVVAGRPVYKSDAGRTVYGGGAITPDVFVRLDTLSGAEQRFLKALAPKAQDVQTALYNYAFLLKDSVHSPEFKVTPAWRDKFYAMLGSAGVKLNRALYDSAQSEVDRLLGGRIVRFAYGDSTAKRRELADDTQLEAALALLKQGPTQRDLFLIAERENAKKPSRP